MKTPDGKTIGEHIGLAFYTFGQRKGIGIGGAKDGSGEPWFVAGKDMASNTLYVVQGHDHPWLLAQTLIAGNTSWVAGTAPEEGAAGGAKTRYRQADAACRFAALADGRFELHFDDAQWAVTPGQSAVLYQGDVCLGGGSRCPTRPSRRCCPRDRRASGSARRASARFFYLQLSSIKAKTFLIQALDCLPSSR
jgi:tRNA-specific 2-thiouridylase